MIHGGKAGLHKGQIGLAKKMHLEIIARGGQLFQRDQRKGDTAPGRMIARVNGDAQRPIGLFLRLGRRIGWGVDFSIIRQMKTTRPKPVALAHHAFQPRAGTDAGQTEVIGL